MKKIKNEHLYSIKVPDISDCILKNGNYMYFESNDNYFYNSDDISIFNYRYDEYELYYRIDNNSNKCTIMMCNNEVDDDDEFYDPTTILIYNNFYQSEEEYFLESLNKNKFLSYESIIHFQNILKELNTIYEKLLCNKSGN